MMPRLRLWLKHCHWSCVDLAACMTPFVPPCSRGCFTSFQVASFALALKGLLGGWGEEQEAPGGTRVVDFGCGSGNLLLPLAALFPRCSFVGIDMKSHAVKLAGERVEEAGLSNVQA